MTIGTVVATYGGALGLLVLLGTFVYQYFNEIDEPVRNRSTSPQNSGSTFRTGQSSRRQLQNPPKRIEYSNYCSECSKERGDYNCTQCGWYYCNKCKPPARAGTPLKCKVCEDAEPLYELSGCLFCTERISDCFLKTCNHIFHQRCLKTWFDQMKALAPPCPVCRLPFTMNDISNNFTEKYTY